MAESESTNDANSWESWLGGWVQTAKEKSSTALEIVKKDLAEFTCTMQRDTEKAVEITKDSLKKEKTATAKERVKAGFTSFLDNISKVLVIPHDDDDYIPVKVGPDGSGLYDRGKARLHAIQLDASTYMDPPEGAPEDYNKWLDSFNVDEHKGEISELLVSRVEVRSLYTKLVPSEISHAEFWQRYFYRVHQLHCDEARKQALMMRANKSQGDSISWDEDDDWSGDEEDNHSDWEKLPNPPQSRLASVAAQPQKAPEVTAILAPVQQVLPSSEEKDLPSTPKVKTDTDKVSKPITQIDGDTLAQAAASRQFLPQVEERGHRSNSGDSLQTQVSAEIAASSAHPQPDDPIQARLAASEIATSDSMSPAQLQEFQSRLWSLPNDTASGCQMGLAVEEPNPEVVEPGSPAEVQDLSEVSDSAALDSCAASSDEVLSAAGDKLAAGTSGGGACGTLKVADSLPQVQEPIADVSATSFDVTAEPCLNLIIEPGQAELSISLQDSGPVTLQALEVALSPSAPTAPELVHPPASSEPIEVVEVVESLNNQRNQPSESFSQTSTFSDTKITQKSTSGIPEQKTEPGNTKESAQEIPDVVSGESSKDIGMRLKGDMVVIGDRDSPLSTESNEPKETGLEEDWEQDFDIEITEDDLKTAETIAKQLGENLTAGDEDWENWE